MGYLGGSRSAGCLAADAFSLVQKTHNRKNNDRAQRHLNSNWASSRTRLSLVIPRKPIRNSSAGGGKPFQAPRQWQA